MMDPTFTKMRHTQVRSSAGYCVSRHPKEVFFNDGELVELHEQRPKPWSFAVYRGLYYPVAWGIL